MKKLDSSDLGRSCNIKDLALIHSSDFILKPKFPWYLVGIKNKKGKQYAQITFNRGFVFEIPASKLIVHKD